MERWSENIAGFGEGAIVEPIDNFNSIFALGLAHRGKRWSGCARTTVVTFEVHVPREILSSSCLELETFCCTRTREIAREVDHCRRPLLPPSLP